MMQKVDKRRVCQQFLRAAGSYDGQAIIQHQTADHLLALLAEHGRKSPQKVLEIGCCTGLLTRKLLDRNRDIRELVLCDLVPDFSVRINSAVRSFPNITFLPGDIESVALSGSFDLIISSSTFHWLHDLDKLFAKLADRLTPGGILAFSIYGPDNLLEIKKITEIGLDYLSLHEMEAIISRYCTLDHSSEQLEIFHFAHPQDILRHLRQTGVNAVSKNPSWTRAQLVEFCSEYSRLFRTDQGVRLTYHPLYFVAHQ